MTMNKCDKCGEFKYTKINLVEMKKIKTEHIEMDQPIYKNLCYDCRRTKWK